MLTWPSKSTELLREINFFVNAHTIHNAFVRTDRVRKTLG